MPQLTRSPLAPARFPDIPAVDGVELAVAATGERYQGRDDLFAVRLAPGTASAGVFTRSGVQAAPVIWSRKALSASGGRARGLVVNAGNANAFTGAAGDLAARETARAYGDLLGAAREEILLASTGVIGEPLNTPALTGVLPDLRYDTTAWRAAAEAMATTDTFPKGAAATAELDGTAVTIAGIAKGSGMICPDMATMLAFVFADAALPAGILQSLLERANARSFNRITVDGDTSTSDMVLLFATGRAGAPEPAIENAEDARLSDLKAKIEQVMVDLAQQVVRDGEGARKFITVDVAGARDEAAAKRVAMAIANSPLVKTAIAGEDPNWGRILMAVGKSGEAVDPGALRVWLGDHLVAERGARHPAYDEAQAKAYMAEADILIRVDLGAGVGRAQVWTCDLTEGYIRINADYRS